MQEIVYRCDNCKKALSTNGKGKMHISVTFAKWSGWVAQISDLTVAELIDCLPGTSDKWRHFTDNVIGIRQFCNGKCLGEYFDKLILRNDKVKYVGKCFGFPTYVDKKMPKNTFKMVCQKKSQKKS